MHFVPPPKKKNISDITPHLGEWVEIKSVGAQLGSKDSVCMILCLGGGHQSA